MHASVHVRVRVCVCMCVCVCVFVCVCLCAYVHVHMDVCVHAQACRRAGVFDWPVVVEHPERGAGRLVHLNGQSNTWASMGQHGPARATKPHDTPWLSLRRVLGHVGAVMRD